MSTWMIFTKILILSITKAQLQQATGILYKSNLDTAWTLLDNTLYHLTIPTSI